MHKRTEYSTIQSILPLTVMELSGHGGTRWNRNDSLGYRLLVGVDTSVANQIVGGHVRDRLQCRGNTKENSQIML